MKSGYDQFFKQARKSVEQNPEFFVKQARAKKDSMPAAALQKNKKNKVKKLRKPQTSLILFSCIGFTICLLGMIYYQEIENFAKKVEVGFLGEAMAESTPTPAKPASETKANHEATPATSDKSSVPVEGSSEDHFSKLQERKKELDLREEELKRVEIEIQNQKAEIEKKLKDLESMRSEISNLLQERVKNDSTKVDTLVQVYSNMKPQQAAKIFETLDEDLAIEILGRMKKKNAADIMNLLKPEKAQAFSERFAGYRLPASK